MRLRNIDPPVQMSTTRVHLRNSAAITLVDHFDRCSDYYKWGHQNLLGDKTTVQTHLCEEPIKHLMYLCDEVTDLKVGLGHIASTNVLFIHSFILRGEVLRHFVCKPYKKVFHLYQLSQKWLKPFFFLRIRDRKKEFSRVFVCFFGYQVMSNRNFISVPKKKFRSNLEGGICH